MAADRLEEFLALINDESVAPVKGRPVWTDRLDPDLRDVVTEVRKKWAGGELKMTANRLSLKIIEILRRAGQKSLPGASTVADWLSR